MKQNNMTYTREDLERMPTQQLDEILQAEIGKKAPNETLALGILDVLQEREANCPVGVTEEIRAAWDKFQDDCAADRAKATRRKRNWIIRMAAVAAVACVLILAVPQAVGAESVLQVLARWTESVFAFFNPSDTQVEYVFQTEHPGLQRVYDTVAAQGVTRPVVPTWVPAEYELMDIQIIELPGTTKISAMLGVLDKRIVFTVNIHEAETVYKYQRKEKVLAEIEREGIIHYVVSNDDTWTVAWRRDNLECAISANMQEELYRIIDSIYFTEVD